MFEVEDPGMQTPRTPLPPPPPAPPAPAAPSLFGAIGEGLAYVRRAWRALLFVMCVQLLLAASVVVPVQAGLMEHLDHHAHAPALGGAPDAYDRAVGWTHGGIDRGVLADVVRVEKPRMDAATVTLFWIVLIAWLFGAVVAGGVLGTVGGDRGSVPVNAFLAAGGANFWRMLRVGVVFGLFWMVMARIVMEGWGAAVAPDELLASSEETGWWGDRIREGVLVLTFLWLRVAGDLARVDLGRRGKRSALLGVLRGFGRTLRHPLRMPGVALAFGVPAFAGVFGLGMLMDVTEGDHWLAWLVTFVVVQTAVVVRWAGRMGVLAAYVRAT